MNQIGSTEVFRLAPGGRAASDQPLFKLVSGWLEKSLALRSCGSLYQRLEPGAGDQDFPARALDQLGIRYRISAAELQNIPRRGATLLIANHPFGGLEGLILMALLEKLRPDVKFLANQLLMRIPELHSRLIPVDPFNRDDSARQNLRSLRQAVNWVGSGGALVIFPAGEVSAYQPARGSVSDPPWKTAAARILQRTGATAVPIYFSGRNSLAFQLAGLLHRRLRTALLPRELLNKRNCEVELRIGGAITPKRLGEFTDPQELTDYLRARTYWLAQAGHPTRAAGAACRSPQPQPLIAAIAAPLLEQEIVRLPGACQLTSSGPFDVYFAEAPAIPMLLREIGRLRELTFRAAGEGTGRELDLDRFDQDYQHLFIWQREAREIVGAYRLGASDRILPRHGSQGLYTSTLFRYQPALLERIAPGLELGRSFIRPEYQKSYSPLLLLWKGIGSYVARHPRYRYLFGPVSISRDYQDASRQLMTSSLSRHFLLDDLAALVEPRSPVNLRPVTLKSGARRRQILRGTTMEEISELVADLEADRKGIPVLLRQYLNLGGRLLAFNLDAEFSDVVDGLILVDLLATERRQLNRYLGDAGARIFLDHHASIQAGNRACSG